MTKTPTEIVIAGIDKMLADAGEGARAYCELLINTVNAKSDTTPAEGVDSPAVSAAVNAHAERLGLTVRITGPAAGAPTATAPTSLETLKAEIEARPDVLSAKIWENRRLYVTLDGATRGYKGDRNWSVWFDARSGAWTAEKKSRGTITSAAFEAVLDGFLASVRRP